MANNEKIEDEYVLGIYPESRLKNIGYTDEELSELWRTNSIGPEIGPEMDYDFKRQCSYELLKTREFYDLDNIKKIRYRKDQERFANFDIKQSYTDKKICHDYSIYCYTNGKVGPEVKFLSRDYKRTISLHNHYDFYNLTDTVRIDDICLYGISYMRTHATEFGTAFNAVPKKHINMFLSLFAFDSAIGISMNEYRWYRGPLLEALKKVYLYCEKHRNDELSVDGKTVLFAMRVVQEVPPCGYPMYDINRDKFDIGFDETLTPEELSDKVLFSDDLAYEADIEIYRLGDIEKRRKEIADWRESVGLGEDFQKVCKSFEDKGYELEGVFKPGQYTDGINENRLYIGEFIVDLGNGRVIVIFRHGVTKEMTREEALYHGEDSETQNDENKPQKKKKSLLSRILWGDD